MIRLCVVLFIFFSHCVAYSIAELEELFFKEIKEQKITTYDDRTLEQNQIKNKEHEYKTQHFKFERLQKAKTECINKSYVPACFHLGFEVYKEAIILHPSSKSIISLDDVAIKYLTKSCDLNHYTGCALLGFMYMQGFGLYDKITVDSKVAIKYLTKACDLHSRLGCFMLTHVYYYNDKKKADTYFQKACAPHSTKSCSEMNIMLELLTKYHNNRALLHGNFLYTGFEDL